jgi:hypothetical protein
MSVITGINGNDTSDVSEEFASGSIDVAPKQSRSGRRFERDAQGRVLNSDGSIRKARGTSTGTGTSTTRTRVNLEDQISGFIQLINTVVMAFKPIMALEPIESLALAKALNQQCQTSPKFRKYLEKALAGYGSANLFGVVAMIAVRRVARADLLPIPADSPMKAQDIDNMCGALLMASTGKAVSGLNVQVPVSA